MAVLALFTRRPMLLCVSFDRREGWQRRRALWRKTAVSATRPGPRWQQGA